MPKLSIVNFSLCRGGAERISLNIANFFKAQGWSVELVVFESKIEWDIDSSFSVVNIGPLSSPLVAIHRLSKYFISSCADAAIVNCWPLHFYALIARYFSHCSTCIFPVEHYSLQGSFQGFGLVKRYIFIITLLITYLLSDRGVAISRTLYHSLRRIGVPASRLELIPNPIAPKVESLEFRTPFSIRKPGSHIRILMAGTLCDRKDYPLALEVFSVLASKYSLNFHVTIAGNGPLKCQLESLAESLDLNKIVSFIGGVDDMAYEYQLADIFFLTSRNEGLPSVLIEALSYGATVVSVDCSDGPREILGDSYPYLVSSRDPSRLASALYEAFRSPIPPEQCQKIAKAYDISDRSADYFRLVVKKVFS